MAPQRRGLLWRYAFALIAVLLAMASRMALNPVLGTTVPFATFFVAIIFTAWYAGFGPSVLSLVLGGIIVDYFFVGPVGALWPQTVTDAVALGLYFFVGLSVLWTAEAMRLAQRRAEFAGQQILERQAELHREMADRQSAQNKLSVQRRWLQGVISSIGDAVVTTDMHGRVMFLNGVAELLTGWNADDAVGVPLEQVFHIVNEHTCQVVENPVARVLRDGKIVGLANHTILIAKDGTQWPIDDSAAPVRDETGTVVGVVLVFREIRARKEAERAGLQLAAIFESSEDAIIGKSLDGIIQNWNPAAERLYGYTAEEAIGQPISLIIPPECSDEFTEIMQRLHRGEVVGLYETVRARKGGEQIEVALQVSPLKNRSGEVVGASAIARDITRRKRGERLVCALSRDADIVGGRIPARGCSTVVGSGLPGDGLASRSDMARARVAGRTAMYGPLAWQGRRSSAIRSGITPQGAAVW